MNPVTSASTYEDLTPYQRSCLPATNYFRRLAGIPMIEAPAGDRHYWKYFDQTIQPTDNTRVETKNKL